MKKTVTSSDIWWFDELSTKLGEGIILDFIGLTLEQIKAQDFSDYPFLCSDLLFKRVLLTSHGAVVLLSGKVHP